MTEKHPVEARFSEAEADASRGYFLPLADIYETDNTLVVALEMPGVRKGNVDIHLDGNRLDITGRVADKPRLGQTLVQEFELRDYHRAFSLPTSTDGGGITAKMADGVLVLTVAKSKAAKTRKIEVKTG